MPSNPGLAAPITYFEPKNAEQSPMKHTFRCVGRLGGAALMLLCPLAPAGARSPGEAEWEPSRPPSHRAIPPPKALMRPEDQARWQEIVSRLREHVAGITNAYFEVEHVLKNARQETGPLPVPFRKVRIRYWGASEKFHYERTVREVDGALVEATERAYDGVFAQALDAKGMLDVRKGGDHVAQEVEQMLPLFLPFEFLRPAIYAARRAGHQAILPRLADLADPGVWERFLQDPVQLQPGANDAALICLGLPSVDPFLDLNSDGPVDFEMGLDPANGFYPVRWKKTGQRGDGIGMSIEFAVGKLLSVADSSGRQRRFPGEFTVRFKVRDWVSWERDSTVTAVLFNDTGFSSPFLIDPAKAKSVFDLDANRIIDVPK